MEARLSIINPSPTRLPGPPHLHNLVAKDTVANSIAIEYHDFRTDIVQVSFRELHERADALALKITQAVQQQEGSAKHFIVPLLLPQCPDLYISQLAILKAGGAFCPLPIDAPEDRLRFILQDISASIILTTSVLQSRIPQLPITIISVDDNHTQVAGRQQHRAMIPGPLAYVMYTSGSTGLPKGVLISHTAAVQAILAHDRHIPPYSRFLQFAAPTFDVSVFEIFFTLFRGRTIICCERTHLLSDLPGAINTLHIDAAELTPSVASNLLGPREAVPGLKVLLTIGEMLKKDVIEQYGGDSNHQAVLHGMYGPTEATIHCTLEPKCQNEMDTGNIGFPLDTVSAFIVEPASKESSSLLILPFGQEGELAVGGYQLADGYLNRDEQTKAAFQIHPDHGLLYRTGDKAKMTEDGRIRCLGRIAGGQVKLRGQRVELGEVEYAVAKTPGCSGAVAEVISDVLVVFCKCDTQTTLVEDVRTACKMWLPAYMIPTEIVLDAELPYLPSGKIDRRALMSTFEETRSTKEDTITPDQDEQIHKLTKVVRHILGQNAVKDEDLSLPGIDSLTSIRIVSALSKLGYPRPMATRIMAIRTILDLSDIINDSRLAELSPMNTASQLLANKRKEEALLHPLIRRQVSKIDRVLPCSAVQTAMLALTTINPGFYCNWIQFGVNTSFDNVSVESAITTLISKHELLRAGFLASNGGYDIVIYREGTSKQLEWTNAEHCGYELSTDEDFLAPSTFHVHRANDSVRILLRIHHALYDQWSIDILKHDLYSLLQGKTVQQSQYSRVLQHYIDNIEDSVSTNAMQFWSDHLKGAQPTTFPIMNSIKQDSTQHRTEWQALQIDQPLLSRTASKHQWSSQAIVQTVFAYLISQYCGSTDIVYGTVLSGRHIALSGIDQVFGPTLTTLPVHVDMTTNASWTHLISLVHDLNRKILDHSATPLTQVVKMADLGHGDSLFDILFIWQESTVPAADNNLVWEIDSADYHEFKLVLELRPSKDGIQARVTHNLSVMPVRQAQQLLLQVQAITNSLLNDITATTERLHERLPESLLSVSNSTPIMAAGPFDLVDDLEEACKTHAELDAIHFADDFDQGTAFTSLSFSQLHQRANQLAQYLIEHGIKPDDLVSICMEKSIDFYVAILGVVKAGAGYLPMVPGIQPQRAAAILDQADVKAIIIDEHSIDMSALTSAPILRMSQLDLSSRSSISPIVTSDPSHVAYTVFTSGSTGVPKGVSVTRGNLHGNIRILQEMYEHQPGDRFLQACLQSFDVAAFEIFFSFLTGVTICTATKDTLFDDLPRSIRSFGITHLSMTPTVASLVQPVSVPTVKFLVTAGEAMTAAVHKTWAGKGLHQGYGPSETTNICTVNMNMTPQHHLGSIGPPLSNTSAFVLDPTHDFRILPQGAHGEFAFGGEQVFRGYLGLESLNHQKIHEHPQYGRVYRSGDLGRILADGTLLIHGRSDFQVKIRGNRVELGEVNATVLRSGIAEDCFTIAVTLDTALPFLVSFWTTRIDVKQSISNPKDHTEQNKAIFHTLEESLPAYMVPTFLFPMGDLPRTVQGKMDHRALRTIFDTTSDSDKHRYSRVDEYDEGYSDPLPSEETITKVLAAACQTSPDNIKRIANFATYGLNSVNAVSLARSLTKELGQVVQVSAVLRNSSIARLARALHEHIPSKSEAPSLSLDVFPQDVVEGILEDLSLHREQVETVLPCTPLQHAMLATGSGIGHSYSNTSTFRITGNLATLRHCFAQAFERHAILRTVFAETQLRDRPFAQVVLARTDLPWTEQETQSFDTIDTHISPRCPICICVCVSGDETELQMHMHHAIYDGTSLSILLTEVEALYHQHTLPAPPSAVNFLAECEKQAGSEAQAFWSSRLAGFCPTPFPRSTTTIPSVERKHSRTSGIKLADLQAFVDQHAVSVTSIIHAAWAKCLAYLQDRNDICFGDLVGGRIAEVEDIDLLVAPCFNTIPARVNLIEIKSNSQLVQRLHRAKYAASRYQLTPLRLIQRSSTQPALRLFDSLVIVQPQAQELDHNIWHQTDEQGGMGLPLVLEICPRRTYLDFTMHYLPDRTAEVDMTLVTDMFEQCFKSLLSSSTLDVQDADDWAISSLRGVFRGPSHSSGLEPTDGVDLDQAWTDNELMLRDILSNLSKVEPRQILRTTSIFQLGLDSLNAAQIAASVRSHGYDIDLGDVLEHRTPAAIAKMLESTGSRTVQHFDAQLAEFDKKHRLMVLQQAGLDEHNLESVRPCTPVQQGMLAQSIASHGQLYINHVWLRSSKELTFDSLRCAWTKVQTRHPILRTGFLQGQDTNSPFFMFTQKFAEISAASFKEHEKEPMQDDIASDIINSLHTPPWRVSLNTGSSPPAVVLSLHHALYDAAGLDSLISEYENALQGSSLPSPYSLDNVLMPILNAVVDADTCERFWQSTLQRASATTFPSLTPDVVVQTAVEEMVRPSTITSKDLERLCRSKRCTTQAVMQAAWARLLQAYLGEQNVTFGTILSSRTGAADKGMIFPCINTVPVSVEVQEGDQELLDRMLRYNAAVQRYRSTPLSDIQRYAGRPGESLFDTVVVYQKSNMSRGSTKGLLTIERQSAAVDYKLSLELLTTPSGNLELHLSFANSILPGEHALLMLEQYDTILAHLLGHTPGPNSSTVLSITPPKQRHIPSCFTLLHQTVERTAEMYPDRIALDFIWSMEESLNMKSQWTYRELDQLGNKVARLLVRTGTQQTDIVAVCMNKCPEASFAFLGILKAGCAFLALDPDLPKARKEFILRDSSAKVLLTGADLKLEQMNSETIHIELTVSGLQEVSGRPIQEANIAPHDTCYCLYTSGTTGTPKGCEISHENAVQAMMSFQRLFSGHWQDESRWLQFASYWFDVSVLEHFWSWSVGIMMVGAPRDLVLGDLAGFINHAKITHIDLTPSLARLLEPEDVPCLCHGVFITGGEALKQEIIQRWGKHRVICNGYGPTEATIGVTMNPFIGSNAKPSNIGCAFDNVGSCVIDPETLRPVLKGALGELCVFGKLVGKGYLNRPDLTQASFPILDAVGQRVYRTGDLVRQLADGSFLFAGRKDSQAKLRGQRLEIDEVDSVIKASHEDIADAASLVIKSGDGDKQTLVSFISKKASQRTGRLALLATGESTLPVSRAMAACRKFLPGYMVPTHIVPISRIPLTVNNKTDVKALTTFYISLSTNDVQSFQGRSRSGRILNEQGQQIARVLAQMLSIEDRGIHGTSNIFSLGLSSVSVIAFVKQLKQNGYSTANVATVMRNPQMDQLVSALSDTDITRLEDAAMQQAKLAATSSDQRYRRHAATLLEVPVSYLEKVVPCTPLQQGILLESLRSKHRPYFNSFQFKLHNLDTSKLQVAIDNLASEVEMLRASFVDTDDGYLQAFSKQPVWRLEWIDEPRNSFQSLVPDLKVTWLQQNSNTIWKPFQPFLINSDSGWTLLLQMHHAIYDGISFDLLMHILSQLYADIRPDYGPAFTSILPYGPLQQLKGAQHFWTSALQGVDHHPIAARYPQREGNQATVIEKWTTYTTLEEGRQMLGTSHQALLQAAFQVALSQYSPSTSCYGIVVSGRSLPVDGADRALGPLFNTLPTVLRLTTDTTWHELVQTCQDWNTSCLPFQHTPLRDIKKWSGHSSGKDLFDTLFVLQMKQDGGSTSDGLWTQVNTVSQPEYPLAFEAELTPDGPIKVSIVAQSTIANEADLSALFASFDKAMQQILHRPNAAVSDTFTLELQRGLESTRSTGTIPTDMNGAHDFTWSAEANVLRQELARLANVSVDQVDEHDTIFGLGLDSIDAVKLASRLRKRKLDLNVSTILQSQTIPRMLSLVSQHPRGTQAKSEDLLTKLEAELSDKLALPDTYTTVERILPTTPGQEALLVPMLQSDLNEYFNHDLLELDEGVDLDRLKRAWETVIHGSPILRTSFMPIDRIDIKCAFAQIIHHGNVVSFGTAELQHSHELPDLMDKIRMEVLATVEICPPLRLTTVMIDRQQCLLLSISHAQYDGHSLALLHNDVEEAYNDNYRPRPAYDGAINDALLAAESTSIDFWSSTLTSARPSHVVRRHVDGDRAVVHRYELTSKLSSTQARAACRKLGVSIQAAAQTCWSLVLASYSEQLEVTFGVVLACRDSEEAEQVMFPTMNTVVVRASLFGSRKDMLLAIQSYNSDLLPHKRTPLRLINAIYRKSRESRKDLVDTLFIYQQRPKPTRGMSDSLYRSAATASNVEYPIAAEIETTDSAVMLRAAVKDDMLSQADTRVLVERLEHVFQQLLLEPNKQTVDFHDDKASICGLPAFVYAPSEELPIIANESHGDANLSSQNIKAISSVIARVSGIYMNDITPSSSLQSLGIDSISAIKLLTLLRKDGIKLRVSELLKARSVGEIAVLSQQMQDEPVTYDGSTATIKHMLSREDLPATLSISNDNIAEILPALAGQVYMLSMWSRTKGRLFYPTFSFCLTGKINASEIKQAWVALVSQHSNLRTVFVATSNAHLPIAQVVLKSARTSISIGEETQQSLIDQPLVSLRAFETAQGWTLRLTIHHALYDAVSLDLLAHDLHRLICGNKIQQPTVSFSDYIALSSGVTSKTSSRDFWSSYLSDISCFRLPRTKQQAAPGRVEIFKVNVLDDAVALERYARKQHLNIQSIIFAAWSKVYATHCSKHAQTAKHDVVLGIYLSNRSHIDGLLGLRAPTLNLLPLVVRRPLEKSLIQIASEIQQDLKNIGSAEHSSTALWEILEWSGIELDTFLNFVKVPDREDIQIEQESSQNLKSLDNNDPERSQVVQLEYDEGFTLPDALRSMPSWPKAYQDSLDIEMTVAHGSLDIGVFALESIIGLEEAEEILRDLRKEFLDGMPQS